MRASLLLLATLAGCAKKSPTETDGLSPSALAVAAPLDPGLVGTWDITQSSSVWTISDTPTGVEVSAVDNSDGEQFEVSGIEPDGRTLRFTALMPSTGYATVQTWTLIEDGSCAVSVQADSPIMLEATRRAAN